MLATVTLCRAPNGWPRFTSRSRTSPTGSGPSWTCGTGRSATGSRPRRRRTPLWDWDLLTDRIVWTERADGKLRLPPLRTAALGGLVVRAAARGRPRAGGERHPRRHRGRGRELDRRVPLPPRGRRLRPGARSGGHRPGRGGRRRADGGRGGRRERADPRRAARRRAEPAARADRRGARPRGRARAGGALRRGARRRSARGHPGARPPTTRELRLAAGPSLPGRLREALADGAARARRRA